MFVEMAADETQIYLLCGPAFSDLHVQCCHLLFTVRKIIEATDTSVMEEFSRECGRMFCSELFILVFIVWKQVASFCALVVKAD